MIRATAFSITALLLAAPALGATYPVQGRWGQSDSSDKGPVDCAKLRVISFNGDQRTDSRGGVAAFRNVSVTPDGTKAFKVVDQFTNGQVRDGRVNYTLRQSSDPDRIEMNQQMGGTIKLQRCK
ncbi:MAG: hypothetical protein JO205_06270 [Pseudolabrys sp.]|nr:hypothetical protein [Pseudolabrys sp.]MBV9260961.1 hypothetical protein [Pseudolabrys sp.]